MVHYDEECEKIAECVQSCEKAQVEQSAMLQQILTCQKILTHYNDNQLKHSESNYNQFTYNFSLSFNNGYNLTNQSNIMKCELADEANEQQSYINKLMLVGIEWMPQMLMQFKK